MNSFHTTIANSLSTMTRRSLGHSHSSLSVAVACSQYRMIQQLCNSTGVVSFQVLFNHCQQDTTKPDCTIWHAWSRSPASWRASMSLDQMVLAGFPLCCCFRLWGCLLSFPRFVPCFFKFLLFKCRAYWIRHHLRWSFFHFNQLTEGRPPGQRTSLSHAASSKKSHHQDQSRH